MFNLSEETCRLQQLKHDKVHGLPPAKGRSKSPPTEDINLRQANTSVFDNQAEQEDKFIARRFRNRSMDFGRRLSKRKGQYHKPGGGCHIGEYRNV